MNRRHLIRAAFVAGAGAATASCEHSTESRRPTHGATQPDSSTATGPARTPMSTRAALPAELTRGPAQRPAVALTFHGQGDPVMVKRLLAEIEGPGAHVTVMAVGSWLATQPAMARRILDGGHELGNHTQNHVDIARLGAAGAYAEINGCAQVLRQLTGSAGRWFRPSQTQHATPLIEAQARRAGYATCLSYDVDSLDYTDPEPADVVHNVLSQIVHGSIVSMHCGHATTIAAIGPILDGLRARGLQAVTVSELIAA